VKIVRRGRRISTSILLSYLAMLIVPAVLGGVLYTVALRNSQELLHRNNEDLLRQTGEMLDGVYLEVQRVVSHISVDPRTNRFRDIDSIFETEAMGLAIEYVNTNVLYPYTFSSSFISEYYVFFNNSELIVGPGLVAPAERIYTALFRFQDLDYTAWKEHYLIDFYRHRFFPALPIHSGSKATEVIPYVHSLGSPVQNFGAVLLFVDAGRVRNLLNRIELGERGIAGIVDGEGRFLISESRGLEVPDTVTELEQAIRSERYYTTQVLLGEMDWTYLVVQDRSLITNSLAYIRRITLATIFLVLIAGLFIALVLGRKQARPWNEVLLALKESTGREWLPSPIDLSKRIGLVIHEERMLRERLKASRVQLKDSYIRSLLSGSFNSTEDVQALLEHGGITISKTYKTVSMFMFDNSDYNIDAGLLDEYEAKRMVLHDTLEEHLGDDIVLHDLDFDRVLMIHSADACDRVEYRDRLFELLESILRRLNFELYFHVLSGISRVHTNIQHLGEAYNEATLAIQRATECHCAGVTLYDEMQEDNEHVRFPIETEQKLITAAMAGNVELVESLYDEVVEHNLRFINPPAYLRKAFLQNLRSTAIRIIEQDTHHNAENVEHYEALFQLDPNTTDIQIYLDGIRKVLIQAAVNRRKRKRSSNQKLVRRIKDYLEHNYSDPALCVSMLSQEFRLSEMYFSRFFKEQMGENFHVYLEEIRMSHALQQMRETDQALKSILFSVGYTSTNTFSRAFRRKFGVSPSAYRNSL